MEKNIWNIIKEDDEKAFENLFKSLYSKLVLKIFQFTNDLDLAEDIVQETFIDLWNKRKKIVIKTSLSSFIYRMSYNKFIDNRRSINKHSLLIDSLKNEALSEIDNEEEEDFKSKKIDKLKYLINNLPKKCKEILLLSKKENLKNRQIAAKLNISIKTVEAQISIAYKKIREAYSNDLE